MEHISEKISEKNQQQISVDQADKMFAVLFENPENRFVVAELFKGLPGLVRQNEVNQTIQIARSSSDFKQNIT